MTQLQQDDEELRVFRGFVDLCPLPIVKESIVKRKPPEPDILCDISSQGQRAFELLELVDRGVAREVGEINDFYKRLDEAKQKLSDEDNRKIQRRLRNAMVVIEFEETSSISARRSVMVPLLRSLTTVKPTFEGMLSITADDLQAVKAVVITRGGFRGPSFDFKNGGAFRIPIREQIEKKFKKHYTSTARTDLLAYHNQQPSVPVDTWLSKVNDYVVSELPSSPFERVWIHDNFIGSLLYVYPPMT